MRLPTAICLFMVTSVFFSCTPAARISFSPKVPYVITAQDLSKKPLPFQPLSADEEKQEWGKEWLIGTYFAKKLDLYRAITSYERGRCLLSRQGPSERVVEFDYAILLCYFLES